MSAAALMRSFALALGLAALAACVHRPEAGDVFRDCPGCPEMVAIPAVGAAPDSPRSTLFAISRTEVTFAQWEACGAGGGCDGRIPGDVDWGRGDRPVIDVSWHEAQAYAQWLSQRTGQRYRLPSSAEWEIAARAGSTTTYSWGDEDPVCDVSAPNGASFYGCGDHRTRPVASFRPNAWGLYDVHGNVEEWVADCAAEACYYREVRGGGFGSDLVMLHSATAGVGAFPGSRAEYIGFRVARDM